MIISLAFSFILSLQEFYPINYLRNAAMKYMNQLYIFQLDIDFLPQFGLYEALIGYIMQRNAQEVRQIALVIPAFETQRYRYCYICHINDSFLS